MFYFVLLAKKYSNAIKLYPEVIINRTYKQEMIFWFWLLHIAYYILNIIFVLLEYFYAYPPQFLDDAILI